MKVSWSLYATLLLLGFTSGVYMETCPEEEDTFSCTCEEDEETDDIMVHCSDESMDLRTLMLSLTGFTGRENVDMSLWNFKIGNLPSNIFSFIGIKRLEMSHVEFDSLTDSDQPSFQGLENYLEDLVILGGFTEENVPAKLSLGHLKKLKELDLSYNTVTELGDDWFSNGPSSLEILTISNNNIEKLGSNAFSQLNNLKELSLDDNRFGDIKRSMLPSTADKLTTLELDNNALTDIPEDIFSGMPSISSISLRTNGIRTLDERTWSPVWQQLKELRLEGNNIHCDDQLKWISRSKNGPQIYGQCNSPKEFEGKDLEDFLES